MKTIKKGDRGDDVKTLQKALKIDADGVFGPLTEKAVKDFQKSKGLDADGIVGVKTRAALGITDSKCVDLSVVYAPLSVHVTKSANRPIKYLAIHYTAGSSSAAGRALHVKSVFEKRQASADFCVDDRDMVQFNPDLHNYFCWAVGDKKNQYSGGGSLYGIATNRNTISIEVCSTLRKGASSSAANHDGWYFTPEVLNNAVKLAKILMRKFNIPIERVVRHYDISGKVCPGVPGWNNSKLNTMDGKATSLKNDSSEWEKFKNRLK